MRKKILYPFLLLMLAAGAMVSCTDDESDTLSRLFMPEFLKNSYDIQGTSIKFVWRKSSDAASYTIELAKDADFSSIVTSGEPTENNYTFTGLSFNTEYWARVKAHALNPATGESKWSVAEPVTTLARVIPNILYEVDPADIEMNAVTARWDVSLLAEFPVTRINMWPEGSEIAKSYVITPEKAQSGWIRIAALERNTTYHMRLMDTTIPEEEVRYNRVTFKTAGAPEGAISVEKNDDLYKMITDVLADDAVSEATFYLTAGASYYMMEDLTKDPVTGVLTPTPGRGFASPKINKSLTFTAEPGERPTVYVKTGKWDFPEAETTIGKLEFNGVNIKEYISVDFPANAGTYFFNLAARKNDLTLGEFILKDSDIDLPRSIWLANAANTGTAITKIGKFVMDGCTYTSSNPQDKSGVYGMYQGSAAGSDIFGDVKLVNSTFYNVPLERGLFHRPTASIATNNGKIVVESCTFYLFSSLTNSVPQKGSGFLLVDLQSCTKNIDVTVSKCLFTNQIAGPVRLHANNGGTFVHNSNYYTTDAAGNNGNGTVTAALKGHMDDMTAVGLSSEDLFENPAAGNFTIKDKSSPVYTQRIGDPRWIK